MFCMSDGTWMPDPERVKSSLALLLRKTSTLFLEYSAYSRTSLSRFRSAHNFPFETPKVSLATTGDVPFTV